MVGGLIILYKVGICCICGLAANEDGLWCLTPLSTIYRSFLLVEKAGVLRENN